MLSIRNLSHVYPGGTRALDDVSLEIPAGMFGLLGPNGAGKSTLMRCIAALQTPTSGAINFDGIDVLAEPSRLRRTLGYLPQDFGVYPRVSALDLLDHLAVLKGLTNKAERRETVEALLNQVNLWPVRKKAVAGFSGQPHLIIVDEPTAGLDPEERNRFLNLLAEIGEKVVVILSTHIVEDVADLCPRMAVMAGGRLLREGSPSSLVKELEGRVWKKVVDKADLPGLTEIAPVISTRLSAGRTVVHLLSESAPGPGFDVIEGDLEDVYFAALHAARKSA